MSSTCQNTSYNYFLSYSKAIAAIFVILIHVIPSYIINKMYICLTIHSAVPIFLMIACINWTNAYKRLADKKGVQDLSLIGMYNIKLYIKRFCRILLPFIVIFIAEELIMIKSNQSIGKILMDFLYGGLGLGRNMVPLLLELKK